jgi:hypothetical protein
MAPKNKNGNGRQARGQFGNKGGTTETGPVEPDNDKAKAPGKLGFFHQDECFGDVRGALNIAEVAPEDGFAHLRLKRVVVDQ